MGWTFQKQTMAHVLERLIAPNPNEGWTVKDWELRHEGDYQILWQVAGPCEGEDLIFCILIDREGEEIGYKILSELEGPCYYSVPGRFLNLCPPPKRGGETGYSPKWRAKVRELREQSRRHYDQQNSAYRGEELADLIEPFRGEL